MGQKANPIGSRLGIIKGWDSNWFGGNNYSDKLVEDQKIRKYLLMELLNTFFPFFIGLWMLSSCKGHTRLERAIFRELEISFDGDQCHITSSLSMQCCS